MIDLGRVKPGATIIIPWDSFAAATGAPSAASNYAAADIQIYNLDADTQRASANGITVATTFDSLTGLQTIKIDLADNSTAGFYKAGARYVVAVSDVTIDTQTVRFWAATFSIGCDGAVLDTTIATLSSQTSFTLTDGPAEDDALNGCVVYIHDVASAVQGGFAVIADYTGSTKTVTLTAGVTFTAAATDNISIFPPVNTRWFNALATVALPLTPTTAGRTLDVSAGGEAGLDWANIGSPTTAQNLSATNIDTDQVVASVAGAVGSVASGGITAASFAANAITAAKLDPDVTTELQAGLATSAALTTVEGKIDTIDGIVDAILVDTGTTLDTKIDTIDTNVDSILADTGTDGVIVATNNDKTGYGLSDGAITAAKIATDAADAISGSISGTADSGTTTTIVDTARNEGDADYWNDSIILFTSGTLAGQARRITAFDPATDTISFTPALTAAAGTHTYRIFPSTRANLHLVRGALINALVSGRMDSSTGAMAAGVVTATAIATDAIDADALAADAVTEIQSGLATAANLATVDTVVDGIKAKTDSLTFTVAGQVDSNIESVNAVEVIGDGQTGTEWGPV